MLRGGLWRLRLERRLNVQINANNGAATAVVHGAVPLAKKRSDATRQEREWSLPGLCWNTNVTTSFGALPAQVLRLHDPLRLADGSVARIAWIDKIQLDEAFLSAYPDAQPVMIRAGALGGGQPSQDILVSPQQKLVVQGLNYNPELRMARELLGRPGVFRQPQTVLTYYMFHCGQPAKISASGTTIVTAP